MTQPLDMLRWSPHFHKPGGENRGVSDFILHIQSIIYQADANKHPSASGILIELWLTFSFGTQYWRMLSLLLIVSLASFCKPGFSACPICVSPFGCCLQGKPCACPWGKPHVFLPGILDGGGTADCAGEAPSEPAMKHLRWFVEQDLPSLWWQVLIGDTLTEAMWMSFSFCL